MTFSIIGYGRFGKLWAKALQPFGEVLIYDKQLPTPLDASLRAVDLKEAAQADIVFLLIPISEFVHGCEQIKPYLNPHSLVVDCCSVKVYPMQIMQEVFNKEQPIIGTHPLFGPDSVKRTAGLAGHKIVLCPGVGVEEERMQGLEQLLVKMGLQIFVTTPDQHDKDMANSQGLVHFIGRGLAALDLQPQSIATPDFQALLNINHMVINDTWRLFLDMHQYNAYTKNIRKKFIHQLNKLEQAIEDAKP